MLFLLCLLGLGLSEPLPKFSLIGERSIDEVPTIAITFPDGSTDTMVLDNYYSNEDDRKSGINRCDFIGHLAEETGACVGMTGCPESEQVEFTIISSHLNGSPMYRWNQDGNVEKVIHPYMVSRVLILNEKQSLFSTIYWSFNKHCMEKYIYDILVSFPLFRMKTEIWVIKSMISTILKNGFMPLKNWKPFVILDLVTILQLLTNYK